MRHKIVANIKGLNMLFIQFLTSLTFSNLNFLSFSKTFTLVRSSKRNKKVINFDKAKLLEVSKLLLEAVS